jgi:hypothetical protein
MLISSIANQTDTYTYDVTVTIANSNRSVRISRTIHSHFGMKAAVSKAVEDIMLNNALMIATLASEHIHVEPRSTQS